MLRYVIQYKFSIVLALVIILLSLLPSKDLPFHSVYRIPHIDKIIHLCMYGSLGFVALMECRCSGKCLGLYVFIMTGILLASVLIEILQATLIASRGAEWFDILANALGLMASYLAFRMIGGFRIFRFLRS